MSEHTPGPWHTETGSRTLNVHDAEGIVAMVSALSVNPKADARLIAAAPDMYAALKALVSPRNESYPRAPNAIEAGIAAIAKAEGRTP